MKPSKLPLLLSVAASLGATSVLAQVVYRETFIAPTASPGALVQFDLASVGWQGARSATAISTTSPINGVDVTNQNSNFAAHTLSSINSRTPVVLDTIGIVRAGLTALSQEQPHLIFTTEAPLVSLTDLSLVSFYLGNSGSRTGTSVAIRVDSSPSARWFISDTTFDNAGDVSSGGFGGTSAGSPGTSILASLSVTSATLWREIAFNPTVELGLPSVSTLATSALPGANVTAFGVYSPDIGTGLRFDTYTVVPEPASAALAVGLVALCGLVARRRR